MRWRLIAPRDGEPQGLPINIRLHRKDGPGLIELARQMLAEVKDWFPERQSIMSADGFYATLAGCSTAYTHLISRVQLQRRLNSSRQRYKVFYERRTSMVAGSSRRNSESTTSRRSGSSIPPDIAVGKFDLDPIFQSFSIFVSLTA